MDSLSLHCRKFPYFLKEDCAHCSPRKTRNLSPRYARIHDLPHSETVQAISLRYRDHNGVDQSISFPNRAQYKAWKNENESIRRKSHKTSQFSIYRSFLDTKNNHQDLMEMLFLVSRKMKQQKELEDHYKNLTKQTVADLETQRALAQ